MDEYVDSGCATYKKSDVKMRRYICNILDNERPKIEMAPFALNDANILLQNRIHGYQCLDDEFQEFERHLIVEDNEPVLWVFGYGSLIWLPNVEFAEAKDGYVKGYAVRFWQGNVTHRGTPESPGRVATLITEENSKAWGRSFKLRGMSQINEGLRHLCGREMKLGGYAYKVLDFHVQEQNQKPNVINAITFVATPESDQYLGPASEEDIANTIVNSRGNSGHNLEYLLRLTDSLRTIFSEAHDPHLRNLERACLICLATKSETDDEYLNECLMTRRDDIKACLSFSNCAMFNNAFYNARRV